LDADWGQTPCRFTEEVGFHSALEDMKSTPERVGTLKVINESWDQASKEALWKSLAIMQTIHDQRESGVYDRIASEVNRRQTLGQIPANVPFLQAYHVIGEEMTKANGFADLPPSRAHRQNPCRCRYSRSGYQAQGRE
jgi:hypothetical protein